MALSEDKYAELMRKILLAEPCRGVSTSPSRLLNHVYIGSQSNAESLRLLRQLGVTHVLNCAGYKGPRPTPNASPYDGLGIDYLEFQAEDTDDYDITRHFPEAFRFLDHVKYLGGTALVHCALGINRSGAVCLGYLMTHSRIPVLQATKILKDKRRIVLANRSFQRQLIRYARMRGLLDDVEDDGVGSTDGSGFKDERVIAALSRSPPRNDFARGRNRIDWNLRPSSFTFDGISSNVSSRLYPTGVTHSLTLPRRTASDGPGVSRDHRWLDHLCERLDRVTQNDHTHGGSSGLRSGSDINNRGRQLLQPEVDGPRTRRAQSTPRLTNGRHSSADGCSRYRDFRY